LVFPKCILVDIPIIHKFIFKQKKFSIQKKPVTKKNNYYDKEKLYQNIMKLQTSLNILKQKYQKKMENDKQAREIEI